MNKTIILKIHLNILPVLYKQNMLSLRAYIVHLVCILYIYYIFTTIRMSCHVKLNSMYDLYERRRWQTKRIYAFCFRLFCHLYNNDQFDMSCNMHCVVYLLKSLWIIVESYLTGVAFCGLALFNIISGQNYAIMIRTNLRCRDVVTLCTFF